MTDILYLSHPEVKIDPQTPVSEWDLSDQGRRRLLAAVARGWPGRGWRIIASPEAKAQQTAEVLSNAFNLPLHTHPDMGELDRSTTGYVPHDRHESLANALFANRTNGPEGWESANAAQKRIAKAYGEVLAEVSGRLLFVGHGAVGSFLWCALTKTPISRAMDQQRCGSFWAGLSQIDGFRPAQSWQALETAAAK
ncbi:Broad specificity phosphatase PhoE [Pseudorhodobacter antarcticus]|jgi:broad specificity phosphatase PhoE|uniref:Broad specificity phosphatase PhoE n=1 Tax=Pseudorhodobacter antarcticus TaxID=1077947 RepID=A0A1H8G9K1_9RHOB|nr:histidine phosphatase family protein [Pseudorhodobacter antarcticus]SEN40440.1 Broad specificity phosphatase PhoE [Pseudorhodobacter antarcticus]